MKIEIFVDTEKAEKKLSSISNKISNLLPILEKVHKQILEPEFQSHFDNQLNPDGSIWKSPKADPTRKALVTVNGKYRKSFVPDFTNNSINIRSNFTTPSSNNIVFTHEKPLSIKIFGRGIGVLFPHRSAIWVSEKAINSISNLIIKEINA